MAPTDMDLATILTSPILKDLLETSGSMRTEVDRVIQAYVTKQHTGNPEERQLAFTKETRNLVGYLARIRALNRALAHHTREEKAHTSTSRAEIDHLHLQLQNLYYESRHLRGEIDNLRNFHHPYMGLSLRSIPEFLERQPHWIADGLVDEEGHGEGETEFTRARIELEYQERLELSKQTLELVRQKQELEKRNNKRKAALAALDSDLTKRMAQFEGGRTMLDQFAKDIGQLPATQTTEKSEEEVKS